MSTLRLVPPVSADPHAADALRAEVREFLAGQRAEGKIGRDVDCWLTGWDEDFSRALAARGWLGMTVPVEYGGHGRSHLERFVVTEELLAAGAPVAAHWIADRQIVPSLLKYGTENQKQQYLPAIASGACYFGIGMSEPDSGSDLASVRTKATRVDGGWSITGTKVWTSGAHRAHAFFCLARTTAVDPAHRHDGLSQFIVDLHSPGVDIRPIVSMNGEHHFNEVILDDVFVADDMVFGTIGDGWQQVTSELSFERSGPERFLSTFTLLAETAEQMRSSAIPGIPTSAVMSPASPVCIRCRPPSPARSNAGNRPIQLPPSSRSWARPPRATSPISPTCSPVTIRRIGPNTTTCSTTPSCNAPDSLSAAVPTKFCAA